MRDIRFRAWDGQRFYYFSNHTYTLNYNDISGWNVHPNIPDYRGEWTTGQSSRSAETFDLQQFTGLVDKNNKNIYEGDIVITENEDDYAGDDTPYRGVVTYDNERGFYYIEQSHDTYKPLLGHLLIKSIEIIGNVYEQPELVGERTEGI